MQGAEWETAIDGSLLITRRRFLSLFLHHNLVFHSHFDVFNGLDCRWDRLASADQGPSRLDKKS